MGPLFQLTTTNASFNIETLDRLRDVVCDSIPGDQLHLCRSESGFSASECATPSSLASGRFRSGTVMELRGARLLQTLAVVAAALTVAGCGSDSSRQMAPPPGNTPTSSNQKVTTGPMLAAWWDAESKGLRVVYGVPGAGIEGPPTFTEGSYTGAAACLRKGIALFTSSSGVVDEANLPQGEPVTIGRGIAPIAMIAFSPSCNAALVYAPGRTQAQLVQGLPGNAKTTNVTLPAGSSAAIVADSGAVLTASAAKDGSIAVNVVAANGAPQPVTALSRLGGMAFVPGADSAVIADAGANTVIEAAHVSGALSVTQVASEKDGVAKPAAVGVSADGHWAAIANSKNGSVLRLDLSGQSAVSRTVCNCSPTELQPLAGNFAFRLNEPGTGTVWAFDGGAATPRIVFLPAEQPTMATKGAQR